MPIRLSWSNWFSDCCLSRLKTLCGLRVSIRLVINICIFKNIFFNIYTAGHSLPELMAGCSLESCPSHAAPCASLHFGLQCSTRESGMHKISKGVKSCGTELLGGRSGFHLFRFPDSRSDRQSGNLKIWIAQCDIANIVVTMTGCYPSIHIYSDRWCSASLWLATGQSVVCL